MSNIQTGAERMPHDLSHLGFLAGQIGRLITISTTPVIAGDSFEMDAVGALRLSPLRRGLAIDSTVDMFTFYVPHRHVYGVHFTNRRQHTRFDCDWSSDVCSSDLSARARIALDSRGVPRQCASQSNAPGFPNPFCLPRFAPALRRRERSWWCSRW